MFELETQLQITSSSYPIYVDGKKLEGELVVPETATQLVIFSHGSGSSRLSKRNLYVAEQLQKNNIATYLFDLLSVHEDAFIANRFNINLLTERLVDVIEHFKKADETKNLKIGLFGASTGAASALRAAEKFPNDIKAIVSRGGRTDLAIDSAKKITIPTLFIIGELDHDVLFMNKRVFEQMNCKRRLEIIPEASHLFEEKGALEEVSFLATNWFNKYLI
jgi:pimeloyl-ACP methyl ester carboxylesterase